LRTKEAVSADDVDVEAPEAGGPAEGSAETSVPPRSVVALRRTRTALWIAVAVALPVTMLILVLARTPSAQTRAVQSPLVGKPAPAAEGATVDGGHASLAELRGRWVVVNFFATWCVPCRTEHPELVRFSEAHKAAGDAQVLAVVYSDTASAVKDYRAANGGDWPMLTDPDGRIALDFGVAGVPESFLVSPDGVIVSKILGGVRAVDLERLLDRARGGG
jgi:cytochrome c biogenesis protein CcmG/thiol:disulfide interchange protein DsbE